MSGRGEAGLRTRLPDLRQRWLALVATALFPVGMVVQAFSAEGPLPPMTWIFFAVYFIVRAVVRPLVGRSRSSVFFDEKRVLRRSVVHAVKRGQELRLDPGEREYLLRHSRQQSRVRWFLGPVLVSAAFTLPVIGLVLERRLTNTGLVLVGIALGMALFEAGRAQRRVVDAVNSWPAA